MTIPARQVIVSAAFLAVSGYAIAAGQEPKSAVAIVSAITGTASVTIPPEKREVPLRLFDWLPPGSSIEVARGSMMILVFAGGARYELGQAARVTLGTSSLASASGLVRSLAAVPPLPAVAPIAKSDRAGARAAVIRIRGGTIAGLYPDDGASTLPESTVLRFTPIPGASRYSVEVETESGTTVFQVQTQSSTVSVSPGILKEGARYYWQVRTLDTVGQAARGGAEFVTLEAEPARARATLKASLEAAGDAPSLALLAEIDRSLGLLAEARDGFRAALDRAPGDGGLRQALEAVERQLASEGEESAR
jgi:hypothetical protein